MLNRNDRIALKRNRAAVNLLFLVIVFLTVWIVNLHYDKSYDLDSNKMQFDTIISLQNQIKEKNKIIDSMILTVEKMKSDTIKVTPKPIFIAPKKPVNDSVNKPVKLHSDSVIKIVKDSTILN